MPDKLAVVERLLAAGAGGAGAAGGALRVPADGAARDAWWRKRKREELAAIYRLHWTINGGEPELDLPASEAGEKARITVEPRAFSKWWDVRRRDGAAAALEALGFDRVGEFAILEFPPVRMYVLHHYDWRAFAVLSEYATQTWAEVIRWHGDGSSLSVSNLEPEAGAARETPGHRKMRQPRWGVNKLVEFMKNESPPEAGVRLVKAKDFKELFERYYAEELASGRGA
jgi:hypothetical protein